MRPFQTRNSHERLTLLPPGSVVIATPDIQGLCQRRERLSLSGNEATYYTEASPSVTAPTPYSSHRGSPVPPFRDGVLVVITGQFVT